MGRYFAFLVAIVCIVTVAVQLVTAGINGVANKIDRVINRRIAIAIYEEHTKVYDDLAMLYPKKFERTRRGVVYLIPVEGK